jgi:hypothetical protein
LGAFKSSFHIRVWDLVCFTVWWGVLSVLFNSPVVSLKPNAPLLPQTYLTLKCECVQDFDVYIVSKLYSRSQIRWIFNTSASIEVRLQSVQQTNQEINRQLFRRINFLSMTPLLKCLQLFSPISYDSCFSVV